MPVIGRIPLRRRPLATGETGRADTWRTLEGVHLQARIVGEDQNVGFAGPGGGESLFHRIFREGQPVLIHRRQGGACFVGRQDPDREVGQQTAQFNQFSLISGGQEEAPLRQLRHEWDGRRGDGRRQGGGWIHGRATIY